MYQIEKMTDDNILVIKEETKATSQFVTAGDADTRGAVYRVIHSDCDTPVDILVLLAPGNYPGILFNGEMLTCIEESDIIATITEKK